MAATRVELRGELPRRLLRSLGAGAGAQPVRLPRSSRKWRGLRSQTAPLVLASGSSPGSSSSGPSTSPHWTDKLEGKEDKTYKMDRKTLDERISEDLSGSGLASAWNVSDVLRDRDNVTLVENELLILAFLAKEMQLSQSEAREKLTQVLAVVPSLTSKLRSMKMQRLARICKQPEALAQRVVKLRNLLPSADISELVSKNPDLIEADMQSIEEKVETLRSIFPQAGVDGLLTIDALLEREPLYLEADFVKEAIAELSRLFGSNQDVPTMMLKNPSIILTVEGPSRQSMYSSHNDRLTWQERGQGQGPQG